jgi:glutamyl-tRNA synthetase
MRGDDHISNTPKQIAVYRALGAHLPVFAHVPMIHGKDGKKLSKRHGATAVGDYQQLGILPGAMRNFLALLGWSPGGDRELFFDIQEMIEAFSVENVQKKSAIFDTTKLEWMNGQHLGRMTGMDLLPIISPLLEAQGVDPATVRPERLARIADVVKERSRTTLDVARQVAARLPGQTVALDEKARQARDKDLEGFRAALHYAAEHLSALSDGSWKPETLEAELRNLAEAKGMAAGKLFQPIRIALTGSTVSEPVNVLLSVVGKEEGLRRLRKAASP